MPVITFILGFLLAILVAVGQASILIANQLGRRRSTKIYMRSRSPLSTMYCRAHNDHHLKQHTGQDRALHIMLLGQERWQKCRNTHCGQWSDFINER
ncbi:hypothetical protein BJX68DRAFT_74545 [Aspergillus pseudodeflectus]|uniref:Uncharacterized protein n=1 Tax=Aspergillus pseudodeflectus TaxID=176178 RepID=A0ABR4KF62_9EURO